ncbi:uncharacterized protein MELLADRAFT_59923 [Melampsora larici-populina 98AG31]|uniref:Uncharacterized protein n=1 Tax=Melampsora larici-populina (strain 98AG31 / pathotype 3-4-7) TaxID=747676 RepID=F4R9A6_MELLP|nr:uncharacterized protein MELLADRAFT_59923 [Melampsora larici-populina 98AG31]EGG10952.1 hypothetical protein MELLADRAFT_59923 [Melampsora larici-populina 98AG31]
MSTETGYNYGGPYHRRGSLEVTEGLNLQSQGGTLNGFTAGQLHGRALFDHPEVMNSPSQGGSLIGNTITEAHNSWLMPPFPGSLDSPRGRSDGGDMARGDNYHQTPIQSSNQGRMEHAPARRDRDERLISPSHCRTGTRPDPQFGSRGTTDPRFLRDSQDKELPHTDMFESGIGDVPSRFSNPLPAQSMQTFEAMSTRCGLEDPYHAIAMYQAEVNGEDNRHMAQATANAKLVMEIVRVNGKIDTLTGQLATITEAVIALTQQPGSRPAPASTSAAVQPATPCELTARGKWVASPKLMKLINPLALKLLFSPLIEGYTAIETRREGYLPNSLFNTMKASAEQEARKHSRTDPPSGMNSGRSGRAAKFTPHDKTGQSDLDELNDGTLTGIVAVHVANQFQ